MAAPKTAGIPASHISEQVDELGALEKRVEPYRADLKRIEALKKAIRAHFVDYPALATAEAKGERFTCVVGAKALERSINPAKLIKAIGLKLYAQIARITLGDLEANVDATIVAGVVTSANTGTRTLTTFERAK